LIQCFDTKGIEEGLSVRPTCRYEKFTQKVKLPVKKDKSDVSNSSSATSDAEIEVEVSVILDIAHNEDAMEALVIRFKEEYKDRTVRYVRAVPYVCLHAAHLTSFKLTPVFWKGSIVFTMSYC
jgi:folylpolyglutamate synthase/dihydropteroate synthase